METIQKFILNIWGAVKPHWLDCVIIAGISVVCSIFVGLVILQRLKNTVYKNHFAFICTLLSRYVFTCAGLVFYKLIDKVVIDWTSIFILSALFELVLISAWSIVWVVVCKTIVCLCGCKKHQVQEPVEPVKTSDLVEEKSVAYIDGVCSTFTQDWIKEHIATDLTRSNTLLLRKQEYVSKLSVKLADYTRKPATTAENYFKHCLEMWKHD